MLFKIIKELKHISPILTKYTDDRADQRNTPESVKVAFIWLLKELDLSFMIATRCAPGHSYMNSAERVMSILNLGLKSVATGKAPCDDESTEKKVQKWNSTAELRELDGKVFEIKEAWLNSVDEVKMIIQKDSHSCH